MFLASVYIHIPFCQRICSYCDFPKRVSKTIEIDRYLVALEKEIDFYDIKEDIDTLFLGGGTPSLLSINQLKKLKVMIQNFKFTDDYEFTIECNPEHITIEKLKIYKELGINRISLGVQTFNKRLLKLLNRGHDETIVYQAIELIKNFGFKNISIDLIFAIPFQTIDNLKEDIKHVKQLNIPHISAYSLILEEKTVFEKMLKENKISLVDNEVEAEMYEEVIKSLKELGYQHYEISNFARKGYMSKHNQIYWKNQEYYGFGMGASGYLNNVRYYNEDKVNRYIEQINLNRYPIKNKDIITIDEKIKEEFLLGLRLIDGVSIKSVNEKYNIEIFEHFYKQFEYLHNKGWITIADRIKLTNNGLFYGNEVFEQFL